MTQLSDIVRRRRPSLATALLEPDQRGDRVLLLGVGPRRRLWGSPQLKPPDQFVVGRLDQRVGPCRDRVVITGTWFRNPSGRYEMLAVG
jgi:hypothetical protein